MVHEQNKQPAYVLFAASSCDPITNLSDLTQ